MPLIETKDQNIRYQAITTRLLTKRQKDSSTETLKTFAVKIPDTMTNTMFMSGTAIQNSVIKDNQNLNLIKNTSVKSLSTPNSNINAAKSKIGIKKEFDGNSDTSSIVSGSQKLKELQELHRQLKISSYEPPSKASFEPRRPTIESIRSAIEKARETAAGMAINKNVGTDDRSDVSVSDASTSTDDSRRKKTKTKVKTSSASTAKHAKKRQKPKSNVDSEIKRKD